jgi:predicted dehydrogenase
LASVFGMIDRLRVGLIGCGNVSGIYLENSERFDAFEIIGCADLVHERAVQAAKRNVSAKAVPVEAIFTDAEIDCVLNLTPPSEHVTICLQALEAGKHVYTEKPLALTLEDGQAILDAAAEHNLRVACAPDTFMGAGLQTARLAIDQSYIGKPVAGEGFMLHHGHEHWHPNVDFYYQAGGGPVFDMGPYYLTALHFLLGPVSEVSAMASRAFSDRTLQIPERLGERVPVGVDTHVSASLRYANGSLLTLVMSFDVWAHELPWIEIHGTEGSLSLPDPNFFEGPVRHKRRGEEAWRTLPLTHANAFNARGIGLADFAIAIREDRPHRANGDVGLHVLETMEAIDRAAVSRGTVDIESGPDRQAPLPKGLRDGVIPP